MTPTTSAAPVAINTVDDISKVGKETKEAVDFVCLGIGLIKRKAKLVEYTELAGEATTALTGISKVKDEWDNGDRGAMLGYAVKSIYKAFVK
jgi:hypothetical protein